MVPFRHMSPGQISSLIHAPNTLSQGWQNVLLLMVAHSISPALRLILVSLVWHISAILKIYSFWCKGNALTDLAQGHTVGAMQADGRIVPEPTFDVQHVASTIVHIASMPPDVAMLEVNIMCDCGYSLRGNTHLTKEYAGRPVYHTLGEVNATKDCVTLVTLYHILYKLQRMMNLQSKDSLRNQYIFHSRRVKPWNGFSTKASVRYWRRLSPSAFSYPLALIARGRPVWNNEARLFDNISL